MMMVVVLVVLVVVIMVRTRHLKPLLLSHASHIQLQFQKSTRL